MKDYSAFHYRKKDLWGLVIDESRNHSLSRRGQRRSRCISHVNVIYITASPLLFSSLLHLHPSSYHHYPSPAKLLSCTLPSSLPLDQICPSLSVAGTTFGCDCPFIHSAHQCFSYFILLPASYLVRPSFVH